jgi:hypothetical protein
VKGRLISLRVKVAGVRSATFKLVDKGDGRFDSLPSSRKTSRFGSARPQRALQQKLNLPPAALSCTLLRWRRSTMEAAPFETMGKVAGIGGLALGVLLLVFRDILQKGVLSTLSGKDSFRLLRLVTLLTFVVAIAGLGAWGWAEVRGEGGETTSTIEAGRDVSAGRALDVRGGSEPAIKAGRDVTAGGDITVGE